MNNIVVVGSGFVGKSVISISLSDINNMSGTQSIRLSDNPPLMTISAPKIHNLIVYDDIDTSPKAYGINKKLNFKRKGYMELSRTYK